MNHLTYKPTKSVTFSLPKNCGFTLIELMITVAIIGIISAIAYPSFTEHLAKGRRSNAAAQLIAAQQWMERRYSENYTYLNTDGTNATLPTGLQSSPPSGEGVANYNISLTAQTATSYTITATRTGSMSNDKCGNLTINQLGQKSTTNHSSFANLNSAVAYCWK